MITDKITDERIDERTNEIINSQTRYITHDMCDNYWELEIYLHEVEDTGEWRARYKDQQAQKKWDESQKDDWKPTTKWRDGYYYIKYGEMWEQERILQFTYEERENEYYDIRM